MKLKENVISSLARDSVIKFDATTVHSVGIHFYMQKKKKQSRSLLKPFTQLYRLNALNKYHVNHIMVFSALSTERHNQEDLRTDMSM